MTRFSGGAGPATLPGHPQGPHAHLALLATDRRQVAGDSRVVVGTDQARRGAVARRCPDRVVRRAEPGPAGPLVLEAAADAAGVGLAVRGPVTTPREVVDTTLTSAAAWAGCDDTVDDGPFAALVSHHPVLAGLHHRLGTPRLSRMPRIGEALGRAVLAQLVQTVEARRTIAEVAALAGTPTAWQLWAWPTAQAIRAQPGWRLRRCAVSAQAARALHEAAFVDGRLRLAAAACTGEATPQAWAALDRCLQRLPGVGPWTAAEVRRMLGDPDAVRVGDYNLPDFVGHVLGPRPPHRGWTDDELLDLLAPYAGQRGRVLRLLSLGRARGLVQGPRRRASRAALSAHRYW